MVQIGTWGKDDIPLYERRNVSPPYFRSWLPEENDWGYLNMVPITDLKESDKPAYSTWMESRNQRYASRRTADKIIDDFEDGGLGEYVRKHGEGISSSNAAYRGDRGLKLESYEEMFSGEASYLPALPQPGTITEVYWRMPVVGSPEFYYGTTGTGSGYANHYQLEWFPDGAFQVRTYDGGSSTKPGYQGGVSADSWTWYRWEIQWQLDWNDYTHVIHWDRVHDGHRKATLKFNDGTHQDGLVGFGCDDNMIVHFDEVRRLDSQL